MVALLADAWHAYAAALATHPALTRSLTSCALFAASDAAAQALAPSPPRARRATPPATPLGHRTVRFAAFGGLIHAPACATFFAALDAALPETTHAAVAAKIAIDRVLFTPLLLAAAIAWMQVTRGATGAAAAKAVRARLPRAWALSCAVWIPAHWVNFKYVPLPFRVLYINVVALCWNVCLANLAATARPPGLPVVAADSSPHEK